MKRHISLLLLLALACPLLLSACSDTYIEAAVYPLETGDNIRITVDTAAGYGMVMDTPFVIARDEEKILLGSFGYGKDYDAYRELVEKSADAVLLEEGTREDGDYFFYAAGGSGIPEHNFILRITGSDTLLILASQADQAEAWAAVQATAAAVEPDRE